MTRLPPPSKTPMSRRATRTAVLGLCALMAACGGGGDPDGATTDAGGSAASAAEVAAIPEKSALLTATQAEAFAASMTAASNHSLQAEAAQAAEPVVAAVPDTSMTMPTLGPPNGTLLVRARGTHAANVWPQMTVRAGGRVLGSVIVGSTAPASYSFALPSLPAGTVLDIVFDNDAALAGEDRNLFIAYAQHDGVVLIPTADNASIDRGRGVQAFDGQDVLPGGGALYGNGALRLTWPAADSVPLIPARQRQAALFLMQAGFGPTEADLEAVVRQGERAWISAQMAMPAGSHFVDHVQHQYDRGDAWRPGGANYTAVWVANAFWQAAATTPNPLRARVAVALSQIFTVSQADSNLWNHARAVAAFHDMLGRHAFGNFRELMQDVALSPAMGIYLSHMRNRKEDLAVGRVPDENFARELMQLFSIGLHELNADGTPRRSSDGRPIETYGNADVMALARVFTGWSWALPDAELTESNFRWGGPNYSAAQDRRIDLLPMKAYPGMHSMAAKRVFAGKPWAIDIPAGGTAEADLRIALDGLFRHPNVGPFIARQLIQRLVSSQPTPAYVARVAAAFNDNGSGVRGDLAAVLRAVLLDDEARDPPAGAGKLREPILRAAHWARALGARSTSGQWSMAWELETSGQRALAAPSVFGHFRPGHVPPNTVFAQRGATAPEFQIVNESSVAAWINTAEAMAGSGLGWNGTANDVHVDHAALGALVDDGRLDRLVRHLNLLLLGGRMPAGLRQSILDAASQATGNSPEQVRAARARAATFLVLASPVYATQP